MISLTFIGHASWLIESGGKRILTDPVFSTRLGGIWPRVSSPGLNLNELPPIDAILISHPHLDHMDIPTLRRLPRNAVLVVPQNTESLANRLGYRETAALENWQEIQPLDDLAITAVPAKHLGIRSWGMGAHARGAVGYIVEIDGQSIYYAGDTAYGPHFSEIRERCHPMLAMLPIGAYRPWFFMRHFHMNPEFALKAFKDLEAKWLAPYHWGSFVLSFEPVTEPLKLLKKKAEQMGVLDRILIIPRGKTALMNDGTPQIKPYEKT